MPEWSRGPRRRSAVRAEIVDGAEEVVGNLGTTGSRRRSVIACGGEDKG
jgi:hypothetical protein